MDIVDTLSICVITGAAIYPVLGPVDPFSPHRIFMDVSKFLDDHAFGIQLYGMVVLFPYLEGLFPFGFFGKKTK